MPEPMQLRELHRFFELLQEAPGWLGAKGARSAYGVRAYGARRLACGACVLEPAHGFAYVLAELRERGQFEVGRL